MRDGRDSIRGGRNTQRLQPQRKALSDRSPNRRTLASRSRYALQPTRKLFCVHANRSSVDMTSTVKQARAWDTRASCAPPRPVDLQWTEENFECKTRLGVLWQNASFEAVLTCICGMPSLRWPVANVGDQVRHS